VTFSAPIRSSVRPRESGSTDERGHHRSPFLVAARVLFLATLFAAPWAFGAVQPWAWGAMTILAFLMLSLWAAGCVQRGVLRLSWSPLYLPFLGLLLLGAVQFFGRFTTDHLATREALLKLLTNLVFFFLAGQLLFTGSRIGRPMRRVGLLVTLLVLGLSVLALAQVMTTGHGLIYWSIHTPFGPFGPYVSANDYCGLMELLIPVAAGYILTGASPRVPRVLLWLAVGVALASVGISGSRAGAAVIFIEILIFGFIVFRYRSHGAWRLGFPVIVALILASAGVFAWMANGSQRTNRALSVFQTDKSIQVKMGDRFWVAKDTLRMASHHPVLGIGVGAFETAFPPFMTQVSDLHWTHAHDDFVEGLAETGLVGGVLMLWALLLFFKNGYSHFKERMRGDWGWIPVGALVGTTGLLCHSLVDFNMRVPANAAWFVVCVAIATQPGSWPERPSRTTRESEPARTGEFVN
jgi:O-antigen ligase